MIAPRWRKVLSDLWMFKARSALVVLSVATGVFAVGMVAGSRQAMNDGMTQSYAAASPAHATLYFLESFNADLADTARHFAGVKEAEARRNYEVRVQSPSGDWKQLNLIAIADYHEIRLDKPRHLTGPWPPKLDDLLVERSSLATLGVKPGDRVLVEAPSRKKRWLTVAGTAHDVTRPPTFFSGTGTAFISFDTLEALGEQGRPDMLLLTFKGEELTKDKVLPLVRSVRNRLEGTGLPVVWQSVRKPGEHPLANILDTLLVIMTALGILVLVLSGFLLVNTIHALMAQQTRQIGVMKAVGATTFQISGLYLALVLVYSTLAVAVAVPSGALVARLATEWIAGALNFDVLNFTVPRPVLLFEAALGYGVPFLASVPTIWRSSRITVREAIGFYGVTGAPVKRSIMDVVITHVRFLTRPALLSLRNTFRRKGRLLLTLATLTMSGAIFTAVFSLRTSMLQSIDDALAYFAYDVELNFSRPYRTDRILQEVAGVPGVVGVETWGFSAAQLVKDWTTKDENRVLMMAPPAETTMLRPTLVSGRWLLPEDQSAVVVNSEVLRNSPDLKVGDTLRLKLGLKKTEWTIVGIVRSVLAGPFVYVNRPYYSYVSREGQSAASVQVTCASRDPKEHTRVMEALEARFKKAGMQVSEASISFQWKQRAVNQFSVIVAFLLVMAVLMAFVGGLALMGTMGINVLERIREIGVIRAVGASTSAVLGIFMLEGLVIGMISWVVGVLLSIPIGWLMARQVGMMFTRAPLAFTFSAPGALLWLGLMLLLSGAASLLPAWNASRVSVRDVLATE